MSISDVSLGLPSDIDADVGAINDGAETLDGMCATMYGRSQDLDGQFNSSAAEFSDLVAWDISSASAQELQSWWEAGRALTHGAAVLRLWGGDIGTYRETRADLEARFQTAKLNAQARVDSPIASAAASGRTGGLVEGIVDAAANSRAEREEQEVMALNGYACELLVEHTAAWDLLMDQADQAKKDLRNGPSEETMERLVESGHLSSNQLGLFPSDDVPLEEFIESASPASVNTWWNSLDEGQQQEAMQDHPELLRDLDGIPTVIRDELNREHLDEEIERLGEEIANAEEDLADAVRSQSSPNSDVDVSIARNDLSELEEHLETLTTIHGNLNDEGADRYLLALDTDGPGRAIVSEGNPDTAEYVTTLVPGMTNTWSDVMETIGRGQNVESAISDHTDGDTAIISWHGYETPANGESMSPNQFDYQTAGEDLAAFQAGLRSTHEGDTPSYNTTIGHSWATMVVGYGDSGTGEEGLSSDSIVFVGGPGAGVGSAAEFSTPEENVHVMAAREDVIRHTDLVRGMADDLGTSFYDDDFFTPDPDSPDGILGNFYDSPHAREGENDLETHQHSGYYYESNPLDYMGAVAAGTPPEALPE